MKETLEEAAEREYPKQKYADSYYGYVELLEQDAFVNGAKWQQERSYSKEEVLTILHKRDMYKWEEENEILSVTDWFEQFKKK